MWRRTAAFAALVLAAFAVALGFQLRNQPRFLTTPPEEFVGLFADPPAASSPQTRRELDELLGIQQRRTPHDVERARADRKTDVWQFAEALGTTRERMAGLKSLNELAGQVETDERPYVRAAKRRFLRLRPYEVESRLDPCIDDVAGDLSYPSGHATYGYLVAYLLADMVPERREQLITRAREFAWQRAVCSVHFPSDLEAGRKGAQWLGERFLQSSEYRDAAAIAARDLRSALGLPAQRPAAPQ
jgi:acid phosphatase (class A)